MKRALMYSTVVLLVIVLAGFAGLAVIIAQADAGIKATKDIDLCRLSVLKASAVKASVPVVGQTSAVTLKVDCPRINTVVEKTDVTQKGKVSEELIKKAMADELKNCWYKMGKGSAGAFNQNWLKSIGGHFVDSKADYACLVCSTISFEEEVSESLKEQKGSAVVGSFMLFLDETPYVPQASESYLDYLMMKEENVHATYFSVTEVSGEDGITPIDEIDVSKTYHVFYVIYSGSLIENALANVFSWIRKELGIDIEANKWDPEKAYGSIFVADEDHVRDVRCAGGLLN